MANQTQVNPSLYPQQGFGTVTTLIYPFFTTNNYPVTTSIGGAFLYWGGTPLNSSTASVGVSDYNNHAFQFYSTGSGTSSVVVQSSIDNLNWLTDFSITSTSSLSSSTVRLTGRRNTFVATLTGSGNVTTSLYLISGQ